MTDTTAPLPPPAVVEILDFEQILATRKAALLALLPADQRPAIAEVLALESEPLTKLLEESAYREMYLRARINDAARANLIIYANGADLDHIGYLFGLPRLAGELDPRYRSRLLLRIAAMAGNGTREHYQLIALGVSLEVVGSAVLQPAASRVDIALWLKPGADAVALLAAARAAYAAPGVKMLGVELGVRLAVAKPITLSGRIWRETSAPTDLAQQVAAQFPAQLAAYAQLGRSVSRSWILSALHRPGVARVELDQLTDIGVGADQYATLGSITLSDGGTSW
ncbi:MAG: baseplate J/gp47 family protein [Pseudomonas sp.]|uniref:baseplate J/gp47 family protein n=1 Tax=Pseudomonas sp. TaxID=306 RepID=UPI003390F50D